MAISMSTATFVLGAVLVAGFLLYRALLPKPIPGIPYTRASASRLLGDVPDMLKYHAETSETLSFVAGKCKELNSPIVQAFVRPFSRPWVIVTDGQENHDILSRRAKDFDRSNFFGDLFGTILPNSHAVMRTNNHWRSNRRLVSETMSPSFLNNIAAPMVYDNALHLVDLWKQYERLANNRTINVYQSIQMCTVDTIWAAAFGVPIDACKSQADLLKQKKSDEFSGTSDSLIELPKAPLPAAYEALALLVRSSEIPMNSPLGRTGHWLAINLIPRYRKALKIRDDMIRDRVRAVSGVFGLGGTGGKEVQCAIDMVIERETSSAKKEDRTPDYFSRDIHDELGGFLQAGFETTASTMSWGVKYLMKHQNVQAKLRASLQEAFPTAAADGRLPSAKEISGTSVPYMDAFMDEVLRHSNIAAANIRVATQDTQILGHHIPKGTEVFLMTKDPMLGQRAGDIDENVRSVTSREADDAAKYQAPDLGDFLPERWLKSKHGEISFDARAAPMQSFGAGLRGCFGKRLAYLEMRIIYTLLVWDFHLQEIPPALLDFKASDVLTHQPQNVRVRLEKTR